MSVLNLFPSRIRFVNADGTLTDEAVRMFQVLVERAGGVLGDTGADVFATVSIEEPPGASDVVQPVPASEALADLVQQQALAADVLADVVQQVPDYSPGTALGLSNFRFFLKDTAVMPGTYGDATHVPRFTVDQQGRITAVETVQVSGPSGANYSGSLTGKNVTISNGIITSVT